MKIRWLVLSVLLVASLGYCGNQQSVEKEARADAEAVVTALQKHRGVSGAYPTSLAEIGFDPKTLGDKWRLSYRLENGRWAAGVSMPGL